MRMQPEDEATVRSVEAFLVSEERAKMRPTRIN